MPIGIYERKQRTLKCPVCGEYYISKQVKSDRCPKCLKSARAKECEICGVINSDVCGKTGKYHMDLCSRHRHQMDIHGKILEITPRTPNKIVVNSDYAEMILLNRKYEEISRAIIDIEDIDKVKQYKWTMSKQRYVVSGAPDVMLHRLIMNCPDELVVDHINHNTLDNRKVNLRVCTISQNNMNREIRHISKSGYIGVHSHYGSWAAKIKVNGKQIHLGTFKDINDAIAAREEAEKKYFGEFAYGNTNVSP